MRTLPFAILLLGLWLCGCSRPAKDGAIRWDGKSWTFPDGRIVTADAIVARSSGVLSVDSTGGAIVGDCAVWMEALKRGTSHLRIVGGPELEVHREAASEELAMLIEVSGGRLHLLVHAEDTSPVTLDAGNEAEQIKGALTEAGAGPGACAIILPDDAEPLSAVVEALRLSQSGGQRAVGFVREPGLSVWTEVKQDPNVKPGGLDSRKGFPVRIGENGTLVVGDETVDEERLTLLLLAYGEIEPEAHLRLHGGKDAVFEHSRRVIRAANAAGISKVAFVTHAKGDGKFCKECRIMPASALEAIKAVGQGTIKPRQADPNLKLPATGQEESDIVIFVKLTSAETIHAQGLDQTVAEFGESLESIREQGLSVAIQLHITAGVPQQRVNALLEELARQGIRKVSFMEIK